MLPLLSRLTLAASLVAGCAVSGSLPDFKARAHPLGPAGVEPAQGRTHRCFTARSHVCPVSPGPRVCRILGNGLSPATATVRPCRFAQIRHHWLGSDPRLTVLWDRRESNPREKGYRFPGTTPAPSRISHKPLGHGPKCPRLPARARLPALGPGLFYLSSIVGKREEGLKITLYLLSDTALGARASENHVTLSESPR